VTVRDYVLILTRNWIVVATTVVVGLGTAAALAFTATPMYTASAQVLFTGHASTSGQDLAYVGNYVQGRMQTYRDLGTSTTLMQSVAKTIGSDETPRELSDRTEIDVSQLNTVATVTASDPSAKNAALTANTLAEGLVTAVQDLEAATSADLSKTDEPPNASIEGVVTATADVPSSPTDPNVPLYLLAGALGGLVISFGVVAVREVLTRGASEPADTGPS
jgi:capsular polysaccharide biosynthesis protein